MHVVSYVLISSESILEFEILMKSSFHGSGTAILSAHIIM